MALRILGIDLGSHSVKVVELRSSFRSAELVGLSQASVIAAPPGDAPAAPQPMGAPALLSDQLAALATLAPALGKPEVVVVALPGPGAATHRLTLPFSDLRRLEQTLGFEVEGQIPFDLSEVLYDYELLSQTPARGGQPAHSEVLVGVAKRSLVTDVLAGLGPLGFDPRIVTLPGLALQQLPLPELPADAILDLGHTRICLLARAAGKPTFARTFDGGGQRLTAALARLRGLDLAAAEALKHQSSLVRGDPELQQALVRALLPAIREVRQTLKQVAGLVRLPVERLWLTGGTAQLDGLPELLTRELGVPVEPLPLPQLPGPALTPAQAHFSGLALGLALRGHSGNRAARFNLRRGEHSFQGDFTKVRARVFRLAAIAAALFVGFSLRAYAEVYLLGKREKQIEDAICAQTKQAVGKCVKDPTVAKSLLAAGGGTGETVIPDPSAVGLLAQASGLLTVEGAKMSEIEVATDQLQLRGQADSFETVDKVVTALKSYRCFNDVQRGRVQKSRDGTQIEFNLSVRNDCQGGAQ